MGVWGKLFCGAVCFLVSMTVSPPAKAAAVTGFDHATHALSFRNYTLRRGSRLPRVAQVAHCTSLALMVRQMFYYARFKPDETRVTAVAYKKLIQRIYNMPTRLAPEHLPTIDIPGYANLKQFSDDLTIKNLMQLVMGDALFDALRPGWHWTPADILRSDTTSNAAMEQYLKLTIDHNRLGMLYVTCGTQLAHALMVYGYDESAGKRYYHAYDSNHPTTSVTVMYDSSRHEFNHPDKGWVEGWLLHPYEDMPEPPYPSWWSVIF